MAVSGRKPNAVCTICGKAYWRQPNRLTRSRFCSNACKAAGKIDGGTVDKSELARLYYDENLSMQEIADRFGCSANKIAYWMEQYGFERRTWSEATYVQRNPDGDPFKIRMPETPEEWKLFGVGIGLYLGEGSKTGYTVALANNDPSIHRVFIAFLDRVCGVARTQLKAELNIFNDCDVAGALSWWCKELGLEQDQFYPPSVRQGKGTSYTKKSEHGTLTLRFCNTKLKRIVLDWCLNYCGQFSDIG